MIPEVVNEITLFLAIKQKNSRSWIDCWSASTIHHGMLQWVKNNLERQIILVQRY